MLQIHVTRVEQENLVFLPILSLAPWGSVSVRFFAIHWVRFCPSSPSSESTPAPAIALDQHTPSERYHAMQMQRQRQTLCRIQLKTPPTVGGPHCSFVCPPLRRRSFHFRDSHRLPTACVRSPQPLAPLESPLLSPTVYRYHCRGGPSIHIHQISLVRQSNEVRLVACKMRNGNTPLHCYIPSAPCSPPVSTLDIAPPIHSPLHLHNTARSRSKRRKKTQSRIPSQFSPIQSTILAPGPPVTPD